MVMFTDADSSAFEYGAKTGRGVSHASEDPFSTPKKITKKQNLKRKSQKEERKRLRWII